MIAGENRSPANPEGGAGRIRSWGNDVCPFSAFSVTTPNVRGRIGTEIERDDSPNLASRGREIHRRGDSEGGGREVEERSIRRRRQWRRLRPIRTFFLGELLRIGSVAAEAAAEYQNQERQAHHTHLLHSLSLPATRRTGTEKLRGNSLTRKRRKGRGRRPILPPATQPSLRVIFSRLKNHPSGKT